MGAAEAIEIARAFLGEHWKERVESSGDAKELQAGFADVFFRGLRPQPERAIDVEMLRARLDECFGAARVRVREDGRTARVDLAGITATTAKAELDALGDIARELGTHAKLLGVELDDEQPPAAYRTAGTPRVRLECDVPIENVLFFGDAPHGPRPPIESGALVRGSERLRLDLTTCPLCKAEHAVFYNAKAHAQDRDDVPFACLSCSRHELTAWGIPDLSSYYIDLVDRLPPNLAREHRREVRQREAWRRGPSRWDGVDGLMVAAWATVVIPALLLAFAWSSAKLGDPVFAGARVLATIACALHAAGVISFARSSSYRPPNWLAFTFAAILTLMIPVLVAMWG
jgi:hypothetical protein